MIEVFLAFLPEEVLRTNATVAGIRRTNATVAGLRLLVRLFVTNLRLFFWRIFRDVTLA